MILGAHESVAGGLHLVFDRAARDRAEAVQLWSKSSRQWAAQAIDDDSVRRFRERHAASAGGASFPLAAHASYLINLNDSLRPLGSRVDRHACIGHGLIGLEPFRRLVNDPRFATLPGYLETPPLPDGEDSYADGLARLRSLVDPRPAARDSALKRSGSRRRSRAPA